MNKLITTIACLDMLYRLYAGTKQEQYVKQERTKYCRHQYVCRTWQSTASK